MRIAFVNYELLPQTGTSARMLGFVKALVSRKHQVTIFGSGGGNPTEVSLARSLGADYIEVCPFVIDPGSARSMVFALRLLGKLTRFSRKSGIDVLQFTNYSMNCLLYPLIKSSLSVPIITDLHALPYGPSEPGLENPLSESCFTIYYEFAVKFSDAIIAPTDELREFFGRRYHKVISAIPNCISYLPTDSYSTKPSTNSSAKIFFHANFDLARSLRELERLSEVVRRIQARGYMLRVLVAGPGSQRLGNVREPLIKLGYVRDPYLFLLDSDLQILPLKDLGMGLHSRIVEGMAAGKPIVASREACCGFLRYLDESGIVVCDSIDQMVQAVCSLLDDPIRRNEMGVRNRLLADRLFSPQSIGVSLERVYSELMNK